MRLHQREKALLDPDAEGIRARLRHPRRLPRQAEPSELRRTLHDIISDDQGDLVPRRLPDLSPTEFVPAAAEAIQACDRAAQHPARCRSGSSQLQKLRDREPDKRWQAHYDLMLAQIVAYQIKAYEYRACLEEMVKKQPSPSSMPSADLDVWWGLDHSNEPKAPKEQTAKKYAEADQPLQARHRAPPEYPLGRPGPGRDQPRLQRRLGRAAPTPRAPGTPTGRSSCRSSRSRSLLRCDPGISRCLGRTAFSRCSERPTRTCTVPSRRSMHLVRRRLLPPGREAWTSDHPATSPDAARGPERHSPQKVLGDGLARCMSCQLFLHEAWNASAGPVRSSPRHVITSGQAYHPTEDRHRRRHLRSSPDDTAFAFHHRIAPSRDHSFVIAGSDPGIGQELPERPPIPLPISRWDRCPGRRP